MSTFSRLAVQFEKYSPMSVRMGLADGQKLQDQSLAWFDGDGDLFASLHAEEKRGSGQHVDGAKGLTGAGEFREDIRIHQVAHHVLGRRLCACLFLDDRCSFGEIRRLQPCARTATLRFCAA
jgi:hypothetical protein